MRRLEKKFLCLLPADAWQEGKSCFSVHPKLNVNFKFLVRAIYSENERGVSKIIVVLAQFNGLRIYNPFGLNSTLKRIWSRAQMSRVERSLNRLRVAIGCKVSDF